MDLRTAAPRFEHHRVALGIGEPAPRMSWIVEAAPEGWRQEGYELEARSEDGHTEQALIASAESVLVPWPFAPLISREGRAVRVRVRGGGEVSDWSPWAAVEAGLLHEVDWQAELIGVDPAGALAGERSPRLRTEFTVGARRVVAARIYATAHGLFRLELNGERVGDDELAPGWTAYESRLRYATYDVTGLLRPGANALGAWLGDGWWRGRVGWEGHRDHYGDALGLLCQLEILYEDGLRETVASGPGWRAGAGPIRAADLFDGETFDARRDDPAWALAGFSDGDGEQAVTHPRGTAELVAPDGPPVRHVETLPVREILTSPAGHRILDFGQNLVGRLRIRVAGGAGDTVTLRHAEILQDGELALGPLRSAKATDTYILRGGGVESWAPRFTTHGFRYAEIEGWPGALGAVDVVAEVLHTDLEPAGDFTCSDPLLQRLYENVRWSARGNMVDLPTDCPQRDERLGWTGDIQVFAPTATFLYDVSGFLVSWLRDLAAEQRRVGGVPMVVPSLSKASEEPRTGWGDAATVVPWTLWERYGDREVLGRQFDSMAAWVDQVVALTGDTLLWTEGFQFGDWLDPTAPPENPAAAKTFPELVATAYLAWSARLVGEAAGVLGREADAVRYGELAARVGDAFRAEYVTPSGRLLSDSTTAYALALEFELLDGDAQRRHAAGRLAALVRAGGHRISTGFLGTPLLTDALSRNGYLGDAYQLLFQREAPSWLYEVTQGATTIWERWDSLLPDGRANTNGMTSFNHYAFGAVADWLYRVVAGLAPSAPGYRRLLVAPRPPRHGLTSASARLRTPYGEAASGWTLRGGQLEVTVTVPAGTSADVSLPSGAEHTGIGPGSHHLSEPFATDR